MRSSARVAVPTFLALICFAAITFAQVPAKQPAPKVPRGSISGRITIKDKPAAGVMVGLRRADGMNPFDQFARATSDQDGVYRITNVAPGSYFVMPSTPAYVFAEANYGSRTIVVGEDESVENVDYSLVRGGVITGKVTDADGRPVIQVPVNIFRADLLDKQAPVRQTYPTNTGMTDDRGVYRIFGILPGKYKVAAGRSDEFGSRYAVVTNNYKQVFHPDVSDVAKATTIEVSEASEAKDVDITLGRTMQTFSVSGHVINNDNGLPVPNVRYGLTRSTGDHSEYVSSGVTSDARGDFVIEGLLPGKYAILQFSSEGNELRPETTGFEIIDQDITDLAIKLTKGASISGSVVLESDDKAARSRLLQLQLRGSIMISPNFATSVSSLIAADGSFHFTGLQNGVVRLSIGEKNMPFPPKGFSISRIERDGAVIPQLQVKDGETISGVKIFVTYGNASLRGTINIQNGELPTTVHFAVRLTKLGDINSNIRPPQVDARGHFLIEGIPAGVYEVSAYILGSPAKQNRSSAKQNVTLVDGAVTDVTLTIDLAP